MKSQHNTFRRVGVTVILAVFVTFAFLLSSVFAQGEDPSTPAPEITPEPFIVPELEQEFEVQSSSQIQPGVEAGGGWSGQVNISNTASESVKPKIAADDSGNLHMVWREIVSGKPEIFYRWMDAAGTSQSLPVNVSNSASFNSDSPQLVVDSTGIAHIVWQEEDNTHPDDFETKYSNCQIAGNQESGYTADCSAPAILSNGQPCSIYTGDWKVVDPLIGIDGNDTLMVTWMSYEPHLRIYIMFSRWSASGSPPFNRTGCYNTSELYYYPSLTGDANGNFHLVMMTSSYSVFYNKFTGASWSDAQSIGTGAVPVIHADPNNKIHAAWWDPNAPPKYRSKESGSTTWSAVENVFNSTRCSDLTLITDGDDLPRLACASGAIYEGSRQSNGWVESTSISSMAAQPDLAKDVSGGLHLVWSDSRIGSWEIFYSSLAYNCSGTTLSSIALAVLDKIDPEMMYCRNKYNEFISLPSGNPPSGRSAFEKFSDLAETAQYEIDFTTMIWDEDKPNFDSPGEIFLTGVKQLYEQVKNPVANGKPADYYADGVHVKILVGLKKYPFPIFSPDQRIDILDDLRRLGIARNDPAVNWTVSVGSYFSVFGEHSHVKMMIVDGKHVIAGGYNVDDDFLSETPHHDMGFDVSGPIAQNALTVFDDLWMGAYVCSNDNDNFDCSQTEVVSAISHHPAVEDISPVGNDVVFSLFRDTSNKTADNAISAAIEAAVSEVNFIQNRFDNPSLWNPPQYAEAILNALDKEAPISVHLIVSGGVSGTPTDAIPSAIGVCNLYHQIWDRNPFRILNFKAKFSDFSDPIHTKALSIDDTFTIIGSQNFDRSAWGDTFSMPLDYDLAEYSLAVDSYDGTTNTAASDFNVKFVEEWDDANGFVSVLCAIDTIIDGIREIIDEAASGSVVVIPPGIYTETIIIDKPLTIIGTGANETIIQPEGNRPAFRITSSDVTIMNMKISGGDGYGIELIDSSPSSLKNIQIHRVVFENNAQGGILAQGLISGSPMNYAIENNTFIGGANGITINMLETQAETSFIRNNIFSEQSNAPIHIISSNDSNVEYSYNLFDDCGLGSCATNRIQGNMNAASSVHDNLFDLNPLFASPENGAYQLSTGSPAIDAGDPELFHDFFYDGDENGFVQIDMGAFEYAPVENIAPVVTAGNDQSIELGNLATIDATYTDTDNTENHSARIDWGDGIVEDVPVTMTSPGAGEVISEHTYSNTGNYTLEVCVTDLYGSVGCDTFSVEVTTGFPSTSILDNFNRANGGIGSNWSGNTAGYNIASNQLSVDYHGSNNDVYWTSEPFGANQEAFITFNQVDPVGEEQALLLKSQSNTTWGDGVLEIVYHALDNRVEVVTWNWPQGWVQHGVDIPVTFANGDTLGARALADGIVEVYKNGTLLATRDITSWSHYADGGYVGLWFIGAEDAVLDDFGGGTTSGGQQAMMAESTSTERSVAADQLNMTVNTATQFWQGVPLGQTASVAFASLQSSVKPQSNGVWDEGTVQVLYDVPNQRIQVWKYDTAKGWTQIGRDISVKFTAGDTFTVSVLTDGTLEIQRNGKLLAKRKLIT